MARERPRRWSHHMSSAPCPHGHGLDRCRRQTISKPDASMSMSRSGPSFTQPFNAERRVRVGWPFAPEGAEARQFVHVLNDPDVGIGPTATSVGPVLARRDRPARPASSPGSGLSVPGPGSSGGLRSTTAIGSTMKPGRTPLPPDDLIKPIPDRWHVPGLKSLEILITESIYSLSRVPRFRGRNSL